MGLCTTATDNSPVALGGSVGSSIRPLDHLPYLANDMWASRDTPADCDFARRSDRGLLATDEQVAVLYSLTGV